MNSTNNETSDPNRLLCNLSVKINLKRSDKYIVPLIFNIYFISRYIKMSCKNNIFKISTAAWNQEFELPNGSYSV